MPATITIHDQTTLGQEIEALTLDFLAERITVRELIRSRVYEEVRRHNLRQSEIFYGLVQPREAEVSDKGFRLTKQRQIDWEAQYEKAVEAFATNGFIILVDDRQVDHLDEMIELCPDTTVTFFKLMLLVGG